MKPARIALTTLVILLAQPATFGQDRQSGGAPTALPDTSLKIQVLVTEYDGPKKIGSLPYTVPLIVSQGGNREYGSLRIGVKVPITASGKEGDKSTSYQDVGTNIDCWAKQWNPEKYYLEFSLERTSLYVSGFNGTKLEGKDWAPGDPVPSSQPLMHTLRGKTEMLLRDGQTSEAAMATDPLTGHLYKIEVTLNVLK